MKRKLGTRNIAIFLLLLLFFNTMSAYIPNIASASEKTGTYEQIASRFGMSASFIQNELQKGYSINQIYTALFHAEQSSKTYEEALAELFPKELNKSETVTSNVYNRLNTSPLDGIVVFDVTDDVDANKTEDRSSVTEDVYSISKATANSLNRVADIPVLPPITEEAPVYDKTSFNDAPYSVGNEKESISTLSGNLHVQNSDMSLPGRNGLGFSLTRQYNSNDAQFYGMGATLIDVSEAKQNYYVEFNVIEKPIIRQYKVSYNEKKWIQEDTNGDGVVDRNTYDLPATTKVVGTYSTLEEANQAASQKITYTVPAESKIVTDYITASKLELFPQSIRYNQDGFVGSLEPRGQAIVISGSYTPPDFKMVSTRCTYRRDGMYNGTGFWSPFYVTDNCSEPYMTYNDGLYSGTITKFGQTAFSTCPSPDYSRRNTYCTAAASVDYSGMVYSKGTPDTRVWGLNYRGTVTKPGYTSDTGYDAWVDNGQGGRIRYAYTADGLPWIDKLESEGNGSKVLKQTQLYSTLEEAEAWKEIIASNPGLEITGSEEGAEPNYRYYIAEGAHPVIGAVTVEYQPKFIYQNTTNTPLNEQLFPLGKGWAWNLPYVETKDDKQYIHLPEGGSYEIEGDQLKNYDWKGLTFAADESVNVNGEVSAYVLKSTDAQPKYYFSKDGRLLQISDAYNNFIHFYYEQNATYNRKLLSKIEDAIGNTIEISYSATEVTVVKGNETVVYKKHTEQGVELLDSVTDAAGRKTTYSYTLAPAKFNLNASEPGRQLSNPYALLTKVYHPTGAATVYTYDGQPVRRYIGANSVNEAYRAVSRVDQIIYSNDLVEEFNRETIHYTSDMAAAYEGNTSFSTLINNGLTNSTYKYNKKYVGYNVGSQYYLEQAVVQAGEIEKVTSYQYDKQVEGRAYSAPVPTVTTSSNNQNSDVYTSSAVYDDYGNVTESTDDRGAKSYYTYDTNRLVKTALEPLDSNTNGYVEFVRNGQGDIVQTTVRENNASGKLLQKVEYADRDSYGNVTKQIITNGDKTVTTLSEYSSQYGNAFPTLQSVQVTNADGDISTITKKTSYNKITGLVTAATDGNGHVTTYEYDALGRVIKVTYPDGNNIGASYDDQENTVTVTNELGVKSKTRWNALGWNIETGLYNGTEYQVKTKSAYDHNGRLVSSEDALGNLTRYAYDGLDRLTSTTYPDGSTATTTYNDALRQVIQADGEGNKQINTYDKWNRIETTEEQPGNQDKSTVVAKFEYDRVNDQVLKDYDALNNTTSYKYNSSGKVISVTDPNGDITKYDYDMLGNLIQITYPDGHVKSKSYDELGRVIQTKDEAGQSEKQYFDPSGNVIRVVDRNGNSTVFEYDGRNRLKTRKSTSETVSYTYDAAGKRLSMTDGTGTTTYEYDKYTELLKTMTYPDGLTLSNQYDAGNNRIHMAGPFGAETFYTYDNLNQVKTVGSVEKQPDTTYQYYKNGLVQGAVSGNGYETQNRYSGAKLTELNHVLAENVTHHFEYVYDDNKNIRERLQNGINDSFTYDELNRISTSTENNETYTYDPRGNRLTLMTDQELKTKPREYSYDDQNRLTKVSLNGQTVEYRYNGDGLLVERIQGGVHTRYYYDSNSEQIIAEATVENGKPNLVANYTRGLKLEAIEYADQTKAYPLYNGHGDLIELRDSAGTLLNQYQYDIWGNIISEQEKVHNPFRYSGELWDDEVELQYLRARWYDPSIGRFINEDTYEGQLTDPLSLNLYTYVENNPFKYVDPSGHDAVILTNPDLAFGMGHTSALIENSQREWYYFYWGNQNVQAVLIDDSDVLSSIDKLNEWGREKGLAGFGKSGYTSSTYIMGDFNKSVEKAKSLADSHPFSGKNEDYWVIGSSCLDITVQVLSLATLYNGTSASRFLDGIWSDETTGDQIPNNAAKDFRSIFYNNAYTLSDYTKQLEKKYSNYDNMGWFSSKINMANFNMYRINLLLGRKP
ncbi:RHS repeat-associated core domain-containing protein [Paenibacillus macerans]|uniref:RHS repeat-associated core domain-containing protein n=1 Tax=Paenibacillus macerans TaxID=44252 RepID=UPI002E207986|nr:RHS repeat-associated core domain-containing protein [Paenibacillus macerans]